MLTYESPPSPFEQDLNAYKNKICLCTIFEKGDNVSR